MRKYRLKTVPIASSAPGELYVGIDASKARLAIAVVQRNGPAMEVVLCRSIASTRKDVHAFFKALGKERKVYATYETGPTGYSLLRWLAECGVDAFMTPPSLMPVASGDRVKTDKRDAVKLATLLAGAQLKRAYPLTDERYADREVVRARERAVDALRRILQQIKSMALFHGLVVNLDKPGLSRKVLLELESYARGTEQLRWTLAREVARYRTARTELVASTREVRKLALLPRYAEELARLQTIPGIGMISAITILVERGGRAFPTGAGFACFCGLTPSEFSTGQARRQGPITRQGNSRMRATLVESAWRWKRLDTTAGKRFDDLSSRIGSKKKTIVAMAHDLSLIVNAMLRDRKPYAVAVQEVKQAA